ncbi:hypothetical protein ACHAQH_007433 [Verticillium albo-atrum]
MGPNVGLPHEVILNGPDGAYTYTLSRIDLPVPKFEGKAKAGVKRAREVLEGKRLNKGKQPARNTVDQREQSDSDDEPLVSKRPKHLKGELNIRQPGKDAVRKLVPTRTPAHPGPIKTPLMPARPLARPGVSRKPVPDRPLPSARPPSARPPLPGPTSSAGPSLSARSPSLSVPPSDYNARSESTDRTLSPPKEEVVRVKGTVYHRPQDFCNNQKIACLDIYHEAAVAGRLRRPTQSQERDFLFRIFQNGWCSGLPPPAAPKLPRREVTRTRREIGIIREDVLPTQRVGSIGKSQADVRRKGASVFARIRLRDDGQAAWGYSDANNRPVQCRYVSWGTEEQGAKAYEEAIVAWDKAEEERVRGYNMELAVYMARLWAAHWTRYGYPTKAAVRHVAERFESIVSMAEMVRG